MLMTNWNFQIEKNAKVKLRKENSEKIFKEWEKRKDKMNRVALTENESWQHRIIAYDVLLDGETHIA